MIVPSAVLARVKRDPEDRRGRGITPRVPVPAAKSERSVWRASDEPTDVQLRRTRGGRCVEWAKLLRQLAEPSRRARRRISGNRLACCRLERRRPPLGQRSPRREMRCRSRGASSARIRRPETPPGSDESGAWRDSEAVSAKRGVSAARARSRRAARGSRLFQSAHASLKLRTFSQNRPRPPRSVFPCRMPWFHP